jgi:hypothetical protein
MLIPRAAAALGGGLLAWAGAGRGAVAGCGKGDLDAEPGYLTVADCIPNGCARVG